MRRGVAGVLAVLVLAAACGSSAGAADPGAVHLTVFAAASLGGVLRQATTAYETANPGVTISLATDSSATLRAQIELGAPADVFLSADTTNPQRLVDGGLTTGAAQTFARNSLTIIVPSDNPAGVTTPADLARDGVTIIAAGSEVPITTYANALVANLAALPGYPAGFAAKVAANVVSREDNVKAVVAKIELGEGDAAIVYATDARPSTKVMRIDPPAAANVTTACAGVVLKRSKDPDRARAFMDWLVGPDGQAILAQSGFMPPA